MNQEKGMRDLDVWETLSSSREDMLQKQSRPACGKALNAKHKSLDFICYGQQETNEHVRKREAI